MAESDTRAQFAALLSRPDETVSLAEAALLIACEEYPGLDRTRYLSRLDEMAGAVRGRIAAAANVEAAVGALNTYLFEELGFHGNSREYYDPRNSFLNDVLDRRMGIPITLSTVYIEVAGRAGLVVEGVGLPGHFLVKTKGPEGDLLIDPFQNGVLLTQASCQERLDRVFGGRVKMEAAMLAGCGRKEILARMLRNLKAIYVKADDHMRALGIVDLLIRAEPENAEELRDRGRLYQALECFRLAASDFEDYLRRKPGAPEASELIESIALMYRKAERLN